MQPISEIFKEVGLLWILLGVSMAAMGIAIVVSIRGRQGTGFKSWLAVLPLPGMTLILMVIGMILYAANDSVRRRREFDQRQEMYQGQLAARQAAPLMEEEKSVALDRRLQSIDGMIGYLDQSIKMGQEPKDLTPIMLFLAKEIKNIRDGK